jgi:hypothetical protein
MAPGFAQPAPGAIDPEKTVDILLDATVPQRFLIVERQSFRARDNLRSQMMTACDPKPEQPFRILLLFRRNIPPTCEV